MRRRSEEEAPMDPDAAAAFAEAAEAVQAVPAAAGLGAPGAPAGLGVRACRTPLSAAAAVQLARALLRLPAPAPEPSACSVHPCFLCGLSSPLLASARTEGGPSDPDYEPILAPGRLDGCTEPSWFLRPHSTHAPARASPSRCPPAARALLARKALRRMGQFAAGCTVSDGSSSGSPPALLDPAATPVQAAAALLPRVLAHPRALQALGPAWTGAGRGGDLERTEALAAALAKALLPAETSEWGTGGASAARPPKAARKDAADALTGPELLRPLVAAAAPAGPGLLGAAGLRPSSNGGQAAACAAEGSEEATTVQAEDECISAFLDRLRRLLLQGTGNMCDGTEPEAAADGGDTAVGPPSAVIAPVASPSPIASSSMVASSTPVGVVDPIARGSSASEQGADTIAKLEPMAPHVRKRELAALSSAWCLAKPAHTGPDAPTGAQSRQAQDEDASLPPLAFAESAEGGDGRRRSGRARNSNFRTFVEEQRLAHERRSSVATNSHANVEGYTSDGDDYKQNVRKLLTPPKPDRAEIIHVYQRLNIAPYAPLSSTGAAQAALGAPWTGTKKCCHRGCGHYFHYSCLRSLCDAVVIDANQRSHHFVRMELRQHYLAAIRAESENERKALSVGKNAVSGSTQTVREMTAPQSGPSYKGLHSTAIKAAFDAMPPKPVFIRAGDIVETSNYRENAVKLARKTCPNFRALTPLAHAHSISAWKALAPSQRVQCWWNWPGAIESLGPLLLEEMARREWGELLRTVAAGQDSSAADPLTARADDERISGEVDIAETTEADPAAVAEMKTEYLDPSSSDGEDVTMDGTETGAAMDCTGIGMHTANEHREMEGACIGDPGKPRRRRGRSRSPHPTVVANSNKRTSFFERATYPYLQAYILACETSFAPFSLPSPILRPAVSDVDRTLHYRPRDPVDPGRILAIRGQFAPKMQIVYLNRIDTRISRIAGARPLWLLPGGLASDFLCPSHLCDACETGEDRDGAGSNIERSTASSIQAENTAVCFVLNESSCGKDEVEVASFLRKSNGTAGINDDRIAQINDQSYTTLLLALSSKVRDRDSSVMGAHAFPALSLLVSKLRQRSFVPEPDAHVLPMALHVVRTARKFLQRKQGGNAPKPCLLCPLAYHVACATQTFGSNVRGAFCHDHSHNTLPGEGREEVTEHLEETMGLAALQELTLRKTDPFPARATLESLEQEFCEIMAASGLSMRTSKDIMKVEDTGAPRVGLEDGLEDLWDCPLPAAANDLLDSLDRDILNLRTETDGYSRTVMDFRSLLRNARALQTKMKSLLVSASLPAVNELTDWRHFRAPKSIHDEIDCHRPDWIMIRRNVYVSRVRPEWPESEACLCTDRCNENCVNRLLRIECCGSNKLMENKPAYVEISASLSQRQNCRVGSQCGNRSLQQRALPMLDLRPTPGKGWGVFAGEGICAGRFIIEYVGEIMNEAAYQERLRDSESRGEQHYYIMEIDANQYIDARHKSNLARFINHSCDPNAELQRWSVEGYTRVGIFAIKDIPQGTEITYDYKFFSSAVTRCCCGAENCRGYLGANVKKNQNEGSEEEEVVAEEELRSKRRPRQEKGTQRLQRPPQKRQKKTKRSTVEVPEESAYQEAGIACDQTSFSNCVTEAVTASASMDPSFFAAKTDIPQDDVFSEKERISFSSFENLPKVELQCATAEECMAPNLTLEGL